jgi:hypothetical protein
MDDHEYLFDVMCHQWLAAADGAGSATRDAYERCTTDLRALVAYIIESEG